MARYPSPIKHLLFHPVLPLLLVYDSKNFIFLYSVARNSILKLEKQFPVPPHGGEVRDVKFHDAACLQLMQSAKAAPHALTFERLGDANLLLLSDTHLLSYNYVVDKCFKSEVDPSLPAKVSFTILKVVNTEFVAIGCSDGVVRVFSLLLRKVMRIVNLSRSVHTKPISCL